MYNIFFIGIGFCILILFLCGLDNSKSLSRKKYTLLDWIEICWYRYFWNFVSSIPLEIKSFIQRGIRGYSDRDTWNFNDYLTDVIIGGLIRLKKDKICYCKDLTKIIEGFKAYKKLSDYRNKRNYKLNLEKFQKGLKLLCKNYMNLWD